MKIQKTTKNPVTIQLLSSNRLIVECIPNSHWWQKASYRLYFPLKTGKITIPEGFIVSLSSVPKFLLPLIPANINYLPVIIRHEFECNNYSLYKTCTQADKNCKEYLLELIDMTRTIKKPSNLSLKCRKCRIKILYFLLKITTTYKFIRAYWGRYLNHLND